MRKWSAALLMIMGPLAADTITMPELEGVVIEVPAGSEIPFELVCSGDLVELNHHRSGASFRILQTFYAKKEDGQFFFSSDKQEWKSFEEFLTGTISASLGNHNDELLIQFEAQLGVRP